MKLRKLMWISVFLSHQVYAIPKSVPEPLPMEEALLLKAAETPEGKKSLSFILSLNTFQDASDRNKFYYYPVFKASGSAAGAATVITNSSAVTRRSKIDILSDEIMQLQTADFSALRLAYSKLTRKLADPNLTEQDRTNINAARKLLKQELDDLIARAEMEENLIPANIRSSYYNRMADLFGHSGFPVSLNEVSQPEIRTRKLRDLGLSNGGFFSGNMVAGFTQEEIGFLVYYKKMRAQLSLSEIKLSVLPVESLSFFSLAETFQNSAMQNTIGIPLFRSFNGSGSPSAATYNFDLTLDGAEKFSSAPPPINVPVGIKGILTVTPPAFVAELNCDFTTGWSLKGRTDIKDGLIIYNNDVYTSMVAESFGETEKPCSVKITGGDGSAGESAWSEAVLALQNRFTDLYMERVSLAEKEKIRYWDGVQRDIASNRHRGANSGWSGLFGSARSLGFVGTFVGGLSNASRFYWHTNIQNVKSLSKVKFSQRIEVQNNRKIEVSLGSAEMCLAWNPALLRFKVCDNNESRGAVSVSEGSQLARESLVCGNSDTGPECAENRNRRSETNENGNLPPVVPPVEDPEHSLPDEI